MFCSEIPPRLSLHAGGAWLSSPLPKDGRKNRFFHLSSHKTRKAKRTNCEEMQEEEKPKPHILAPDFTSPIFRERWLFYHPISTNSAFAATGGCVSPSLPLHLPLLPSSRVPGMALAPRARNKRVYSLCLGSRCSCRVLDLSTAWNAPQPLLSGLTRRHP